MKKNILCQSPVFSGNTHTSAISETIELAKHADRLGYQRFWVSEHHNTNAFASASPEILCTSIGYQTSQIRIGTGGILLGNYSPLKIAEQANMLSALFPNRFDLGIGRAGGSDAKTLRYLESALLTGNDTFLRFKDLIAFVEHQKSDSVYAHPKTDSKPEFWVLGTSVQSAKFAAENGLKYSFASFINDEQCMQAIQTYYQYFTPSRYLSSPYINLGIFVVCAEREEKALELVKPSEAWFVESFIRGKSTSFPTLEDAKRMRYSVQEEMILNHRRKSRYVGTKEQIEATLNHLANSLRIHEVTLVTIVEHFEDRLQSYKLLADGI